MIKTNKAGSLRLLINVTKFSSCAHIAIARVCPSLAEKKNYRVSFAHSQKRLHISNDG